MPSEKWPEYFISIPCSTSPIKQSLLPPQQHSGGSNQVNKSTLPHNTPTGSVLHPLEQRIPHQFSLLSDGWYTFQLLGILNWSNNDQRINTWSVQQSKYVKIGKASFSCLLLHFSLPGPYITAHCLCNSVMDISRVTCGKTRIQYYHFPEKVVLAMCMLELWRTTSESAT